MRIIPILIEIVIEIFFSCRSFYPSAFLSSISIYVFEFIFFFHRALYMGIIVEVFIYVVRHLNTCFENGLLDEKQLTFFKMLSIPCVHVSYLIYSGSKEILFACHMDGQYNSIHSSNYPFYQLYPFN